MVHRFQKKKKRKSKTQVEERKPKEFNWLLVWLVYRGETIEIKFHRLVCIHRDTNTRATMRTESTVTVMIIFVHGYTLQFIDLSVNYPKDRGKKDNSPIARASSNQCFTRTVNGVFARSSLSYIMASQRRPHGSHANKSVLKIHMSKSHTDACSACRHFRRKPCEINVHQNN